MTPLTILPQTTNASPTTNVIEADATDEGILSINLDALSLSAREHTAFLLLLALRRSPINLDTPSTSCSQQLDVQPHLCWAPP